MVVRTIKYEIGSTNIGVLKRMYYECCTIFRTLEYCKKHNINFNEWTAIYEKDTDTIVANFGRK